MRTAQHDNVPACTAYVRLLMHRSRSSAQLKVSVLPQRCRRLAAWHEDGDTYPENMQLSFETSCSGLKCFTAREIYPDGPQYWTRAGGHGGGWERRGRPRAGARFRGGTVEASDSERRVRLPLGPPLRLSCSPQFNYAQQKRGYTNRRRIHDTHGLIFVSINREGVASIR